MKIRESTLTAEYVREILTYNPDTGIFHWKVFKKGGCYPGMRAGNTGGEYILIRIDGIIYLASRLAWLYVTGSWPSILIDHKNGNKLDNRFDNLREATQSQNGMNKNKLLSNNTSGITGVRFERWSGKWRAHIKVRSKCMNLGRYRTVDEAVQARREAEKKYFGEFSPHAEAGCR